MIKPPTTSNHVLHTKRHGNQAMLCYTSAIPSKNAVSAKIKHCSFKRLISGQFTKYCGKKLYERMFNVADTAFSYRRAMLVC